MSHNLSDKLHKIPPIIIQNTYRLPKKEVRKGLITQVEPCHVKPEVRRWAYVSRNVKVKPNNHSHCASKIQAKEPWLFLNKFEKGVRCKVIRYRR